ncbi:proton pump-interactor 1-like [Telopea speciosissima]|uniref:proton pump-interactor 1-like n=1 Tax=Telopea speciosissima TaxID=54955 RepID=UPI001CC560CA|nr:proton pump-interactor 1-like [Telopea speciosissima]
MGVEVAEADFTQAPVKDGFGILNEKDSTKPNQIAGLDEPTKSGSQGTDAPAKGLGDSDPDVNNFPKDAVDEWPAPKQIYYFYFVKYRSYDDPKLKAKIDQADKEVQRKSQSRFQIIEALKAKKSDRAQVIAQLKPLTLEDRQYRMIMGEKRKEMEPLQQALGKLRSANNVNRERGFGLCSSEAELNELIQSMHYRMQHDSLTLAEEKQLIKEIKQLEGTREKVIANAAMKAKIEDSLGQKEVIQDHVKLIGVDMDGVRKEQQAIRAKIKHLEDELNAIDNEISSLQEELTAVNHKRDKAYETLVELRKQRDEGNAVYYQNRSLLNNARELAAKKDVAALEELCHTEVERFISLWSSSKAFRDDYEKRILPSLDSRQLSRDGRMRNPDEKPLISEAPIPAEPETLAKASVKRTKEDPKPSTLNDSISIQKVKKEDTDKLRESENTAKGVDLEDKGISGLEKPKVPSTVNVIDEAKLKEMKREEEIAKAKSALERKKKLAEKAAAKAAVRAEKEAEKKLKEREKRAKKKATASQPPSNPEEKNEAADTEAVEAEKADVEVEPPVPTKSKELKENTIRYRNRPKGEDSRPKIILKRKKATPYWVWAAPVAAVVLLLLALGYYYFL